MPSTFPDARTRRLVLIARSVGSPPPPAQGNHAAPGEEGPADQPLQPASGEVLRLAQEDHFPRQRQRPEEVIGERQVVTREDDRASSGHVLNPPRAGPEEDPPRYPQ